MIYDPEDEVVVISAEGVGKGVLRDNTISVTSMQSAVRWVTAAPDKIPVGGTVHSIRPTRSERLCARCPYPSRPATHLVTFTSGTYRTYHEKIYLCDGCTEKVRS